MRMAGQAVLPVMLCVAFSSPAAAAIVSCPALSGTPPTGAPLSNYVPASATEGCQTTDYSFNLFTVDSSSSGQMIAGVTVPTATVTTAATQIYIATGVVDPQAYLLTAPGNGGGGSKADQNNCGPNSGDVGWCISGTAGSTRTLISTVQYTINSRLGSTIQYIGYSGVIWSHSSGGGGSTALIFREYCAGGTITTWGDSNNCSGEYGVLRAGQIVGGFENLPFNQVAGLSMAYSSVQIRDTVYLSTGTSGGSWAAVLPFEFIDTPEPSTFALMGLALGGLALWRRRRSSNV